MEVNKNEQQRQRQNKDKQLFFTIFDIIFGRTVTSTFPFWS